MTLCDHVKLLCFFEETKVQNALVNTYIFRILKFESCTPCNTKTFTWDSNLTFDCNKNVFRQSEGVQGKDKVWTRWSSPGDDNGFPVFLWLLVDFYVGPKQGTARKERATTYCETLVPINSSVWRQITKCYNLQFQNIQNYTHRR